MTTQTANRQRTIGSYRDGQSIPLSLGWSLSLWYNDGGEVPYLQGFVHSPCGKGSASLAAAREYGYTSDEWEIEIPDKVMRQLQDEGFDQFE